MSHSVSLPELSAATVTIVKSSAATDVERALDRVQKWVEEHNYRGYEPFDGLSSWARPLAFGNELAERILQQAIRQSPLNLRPLFGVRPQDSTKGRGYMAWGYLSRYRATGSPEYLDKAIACLEWLDSHKAPAFQYHSWSNHFDFVGRGGGYTKDQPILVWSALIGHAYLEAFEITGRDCFLRIAESTCNWILQLPRERTSNGDCLSYLAHRQSSIHNANMLGAGLLARTAGHNGSKEYLRVARSAMEYSCSRQMPDGSWWYAEEPKYHWIDNFHTGYNLDSLDFYVRAAKDAEFLPNLGKGLEFYKTNFFEDSGRPKYYHTRTYPVDIQCAAQAIDTLALFSERDPECLDLAAKVAAWTIRNMQHAKGYFYYRQYPLLKAKTPMLHWGQATMFRALAHLLLRLRSAGQNNCLVHPDCPVSDFTQAMIGVIANPSEHAVVREFFELFKTPWEFYRPERRYEVLLCAGEGDFRENAARLIVVYAGQELPFDATAQIQSASLGKDACSPSYKGTRIPIYGESSAFRKNGPSNDEGAASKPILHLRNTSGTRIIRIGYDLFQEVRVLLTAGQPAANAGIPTLELHIALLRDLIVSCGIPLVEIPPVPEGYRFIACLTHDVDHPSLRRHKFDHTMFGFLYRSTVGSLIGSLRGRVPLRHLLKNWAAAFKLPLVYLGLAKDFWLDFGAYTKLEHGLPSSFFVIPFKGCSGRIGQAHAPSRRASAYGASDISEQIRELMPAGCEIGLHGIDAWIDCSSGSSEMEQIRQITGAREIGVRMHWLYFDEQSPIVLEQAGADYDSTSGYNQTIGYRAGTTQAYKFLEANRLLELPMHVMDTALFFPCYLGLSFREAMEQIGGIIDNAVQFGGCLTVNWHDRSIAPERLWGDVYAEVVGELKQKGAWFATAAQAVAWFRKRRSVVLEGVRSDSGSWPAIAVDNTNELPALLSRTHHGTEPYRDVAIAEVDPCGAGLDVKHAMHTSVAS